MALSRESALTIKCSSCGNQVKISMMGNHLCRGPTAGLSPPLESKDNFDDSFGQPSYTMFGRTPPQMDTTVASRHLINRGQLIPVSQPSASRNASPVAGQSPPALSRFSPQPPQAQRPGGYGGFAERAAHKEPGKQAGGFFGRSNAGPFNHASRPSSGRSAFPTRKDSLDMWDGPSAEDLARTIDRPGTGFSYLSGGNYTITIAPPRASRKNDYGGFGPPSTATSSSEPRSPDWDGQSGTYPNPAAPVESPRKQESTPVSHMDPTHLHGRFGHQRQRSIGPDRSRKPPPRTSLLGKHTPRGSGPVDVAAEFGVSNPYHTSSDSMSSGYSTLSDASHSTAQTSPARSQTHRDGDVDDLSSSVEKLRSRHAAPRRGTPPVTESPYEMSPQEMRYDLAVQPGQLEQLFPSKAYNGQPRYANGRNDTYQGQVGSPAAAAGPRTPGLGRMGSREAMRSLSRGDCKACRLPITGKSISSAEGRLTGKYHKTCFVCARCYEPFASTEFYVLDDKPYCEQHYHKLNGSLCGGCGVGIEGQYLEDDAHVKYHSGCFRCLDCGRSLRDGYFEVDGEAFCERDAWKRTQPPSGGGFGYPDESRVGAGRRPNHGAAGRYPGARSGPGSTSAPRDAALTGKPLPGEAGRPLPKMNKRMTRLGRM